GPCGGRPTAGPARSGAAGLGSAPTRRRSARGGAAWRRPHREVDQPASVGFAPPCQTGPSFFFDMGETLRALMKMGLNLIAAYCPKTPVNHESFAHSIRVIKGEVQIPLPVLEANG